MGSTAVVRPEIKRKFDIHNAIYDQSSNVSDLTQLQPTDDPALRVQPMTSFDMYEMRLSRV